MSKREANKLIQIDSPCTTDWNSMIGNNQIRFCQHCELTVHDISGFTEKELKRLVRNSGSGLCVRYREPLVNISVRRAVLRTIARRTSPLATAALTAGVTLSTATASPIKINPRHQNPPINRSLPGQSSVFKITDGSSVIRGVVFDPSAAIISGASVRLMGPDQRFAITNDAGEYSFDRLNAGTYSLQIAAPGFMSTEVPNVVLRENDESRIDQTLGLEIIKTSTDTIADLPVRVESIEIQGGASIRFATEPLVRAAQLDDLDELNGLLSSHRNVNIRDSVTDMTALEAAVEHGNREMVQALIWAKADVNSKNRSGQTVLMMLSEKATADIVWDLINAGAKVNLKDNEGDTALSEAARMNNTDALKVLLDAGAKVNVTNDEGLTPLMLAADRGLVNNVRALLLAGADVNAKSREGKTALNFARENNEGPVIRFLLSYGAVETIDPDDDPNHK